MEIDKIVLNGTSYDIASGSGEGLSLEVKEALLSCFRHVAFLDDDEDYYQNLYDALYPPVPPSALVSISCTYTQSGTVYDTDSLDSLRPDLTVLAHYDGGSDRIVTAYALSGTLTEGSSIITVTCGGKTATFTVTVTHKTVIDYTLDALENVTWTDNQTYNTNTGQPISATNEHCTSKFTVQDTLYMAQDTSDACTYFAIFVWDENDNYLGRTEWGGIGLTEQPVQLKPEYKYALKAYSTNFDSSALSLLPVDRRSANPYQEFTINLYDYVDSMTASGKRAELVISSMLDEQGIDKITFANRTKNISCFGILGDTFPSFNVLSVGYILYGSGQEPLLRIVKNDVASFDALKSYIVDNNITVTFNYE